jgi:hypothetical protein
MAKSNSDVVVSASTTKKNGGVVVPADESAYYRVKIKGVDPILFHAYDVEAVEAKGKLKKGDEGKKTDNIESYLYRGKKNDLVLPGLNFKAALCESAKSYKDPRSPRKSMKDLVRAGIKCREDASFGVNSWDYIDKRGACVQMSRITRQRPALNAGWELEIPIEVLLPEYINEEQVHQLVHNAGRVVGLCDFRPDFGLFRIMSFEKVQLS